MDCLRRFITEEDGMGTVEIVLIIIVLIALVAAFKSGISDIISGIINRIKKSANDI